MTSRGYKDKRRERCPHKWPLSCCFTSLRDSTCFHLFIFLHSQWSLGFGKRPRLDFHQGLWFGVCCWSIFLLQVEKQITTLLPSILTYYCHFQFLQPKVQTDLLQGVLFFPSFSLHSQECVIYIPGRHPLWGEGGYRIKWMSIWVKDVLLINLKTRNYLINGIVLWA